MRLNLTNPLPQQLKHLEGHKIERVFRRFYEMKLDAVPDSMKDQETDGNLTIWLSNGQVLRFSPNTENFTVGWEFGSKENLSPEIQELTSNEYWNQRTGIKIREITPVLEFLETPSGVDIQFENGLQTRVVYISEGDYTCDAMVIR